MSPLQLKFTDTFILQNFSSNVKSFLFLRKIDRFKKEMRTPSARFACVGDRFGASSPPITIGGTLCRLLLLVEMRRIELLSENPSIQPSSWTVCYLDFPLTGASRHASMIGSPFLLDRFKGERPMQVHRCDDVQSKAAVLIGGTGGPQATALPVLRYESVKLRQP